MSGLSDGAGIARARRPRHVNATAIAIRWLVIGWSDSILGLAAALASRRDGRSRPAGQRGCRRRLRFRADAIRCTVCRLPGLRRGAVVAEAEREQIGGAAEGGVGAASVGGWDEHAAFFRRLLQDFFELPRLNQRNVGGYHERVVDAALLTNPCSHFDGAGLAGVL